LIARARLIIGAQLFFGLAAVVVVGIAYADAVSSAAVLSLAVVATLALSQVAPAVLAAWLLRRGHERTGLLVSGAAAFVPGGVITFLALSSFGELVVLVIGTVGVVLMAMGFHQLWVRSRLP
jgi:hypothetical protein